MRKFLTVVCVFLLCGFTRAWADPPIAVLNTPSPLIGPAPLTVDFDASDSSDDGTIELYELYHGHGFENNQQLITTPFEQEGFSPEMSHTYDTPGTYINVHLRVQDNDGEWSEPSSNYTIVVTEPGPPETFPCPSTSNSPPGAKLFGGPKTGDAPLEVYFNAGESFDLDGALVKYHIDHGISFDESASSFSEGIAVPDPPFYEGTNDNELFTYTKPGIYHNVHLRVQDDDGCWSEPSYSWTITVKGPSPTAVLEADPIQGAAPLKVVFDAANSSADSAIKNYIYFFGNAEAEPSTLPGHTYIYDTPGTYDAYLQVQAGYPVMKGGSDKVTITVEGPNVPPTAKLEADPEQGDAPLTVDFDGSDSNDGWDGEVEQYVFNFDDGSPLFWSEGPFKDHEYLNPGIYEAKLRVLDDDGEPSDWSDKVTITVTEPPPPNVPPTAVLKAEPITGDAYLTVYFHAGGSYDVDGTIEKYIFDFGDDGEEEDAVTDEPAASHTYKKPGFYTATLVVRDDDHAPSASDPFPGLAAVRIEVKEPPAVQPPNICPTAVLKAEPITGDVPLTVSFNASDSTDSDGTVTQYIFYYGEGPAFVTGESVTTHKYTTEGIYTATVRVQDNDGCWSEPSFPWVTISVLPPEEGAGEAPEDGSDNASDDSGGDPGEAPEDGSDNASDDSGGDPGEAPEEGAEQAPEEGAEQAPQEGAEKAAADERKAELKRQAEEVIKASEDKRKAEEQRQAEEEAKKAARAEKAAEKKKAKEAAEDKRKAERDRQAEQEEGEAAEDSRQAEQEGAAEDSRQAEPSRETDNTGQRGG